MEAYNYQEQRWVSGKDAAKAIIDQGTESLLLLDDPKYLELMGYSVQEVPAIKWQITSNMAEAWAYLKETR